jgi:hypothetical protein
MPAVTEPHAKLPVNPKDLTGDTDIRKLKNGFQPACEQVNYLQVPSYHISASITAAKAS